MSLLIVGSVALDDIYTEHGSAKNTLGGSASYAGVAAGFFTRVNMVGIIGDDFPKRDITLFKKRNVDLQGLERVPGGKTFRWSGKYHKNFSTRDTLSIHLNVFETFRPKIPVPYARTPFVLLANIDPDLQLMVLDQIRGPRFIAADTMDLWMNIKPDRVRALVRKVDLIVMNDEEAEQFTGEGNVIRAGRKILKTGVRYAIIKKGAHGAVLFSKKAIFQVPAFPLERVIDPTGAGDCFIGGFMGYLAAAGSTSWAALKKAMLYGTVTASFNVEAFSLNNLRKIGKADLTRRYRQLVRTVQI